VFQIHGIDQHGKAVLKKQLKLNGAIQALDFARALKLLQELAQP
jgi:hypothetical protein